MSDTINIEVIEQCEDVVVNISECGGGGAVDSVNGQTGVVVLNTSNVPDTFNKRYVTDAQLTLIGLTASKEDVANKSTSVVTDQASNTKYPSVKAVYDWVISLGYITVSALTGYATQTWVTSQGYITNVITALGYTPANKAGDTFTGAISATNLSGTNTGDNAANTTSNSYADGKVSDTAYNATSWDAVTGIAPSKNAVRDKIEAMDTAIALNTAKVTNATHTGEVTGATALTVDKTAITNKTAVTLDGADYVLFSDTSDSGNLKKGLVSDLGGFDDGDFVLVASFKSLYNF